MVIGSDPTVRGAGFGQALMRSRLDRCDAEGAPAYLEASREELMPYYMQVRLRGHRRDDSFPTAARCMWPMWRAPR